jgi:hypothetical protein
VQSSIYYSEEDAYLIDKLGKKAMKERKSKSSCLLSILERYFESGNRIGEILTDRGLLDKEKLEAGLEKQGKGRKDKKIGEILVEEDYVREIDIDRALEVQRITREDGSLPEELR